MERSVEMGIMSIHFNRRGKETTSNKHNQRRKFSRAPLGNNLGNILRLQSIQLPGIIKVKS